MNSRPEKLPRLELIEWADSYTPGGSSWIDHEAIKQHHNTPCICYSAGFVVNENDSTVAIAGSWSLNQQSGTMVIPKSAILRRKRLRV
ncbi:MAG: hypothetical protein ACREHV_14400 [Rhizomicrobium sp.]